MSENVLQDRVAELEARLARMAEGGSRPPDVTASRPKVKAHPWRWKYCYRVVARAFLNNVVKGQDGKDVTQGFLLEEGDWYGSDEPVVSPALQPDDDLTRRDTEKMRETLDQKHAGEKNVTVAEVATLREQNAQLQTQLGAMLEKLSRIEAQQTASMSELAAASKPPGKK